MSLAVDGTQKCLATGRRVVFSLLTLYIVERRMDLHG